MEMVHKKSEQPLEDFQKETCRQLQEIFPLLTDETAFMYLSQYDWEVDLTADAVLRGALHKLAVSRDKTGEKYGTPAASSNQLLFENGVQDENGPDNSDNETSILLTVRVLMPREGREYNKIVKRTCIDVLQRCNVEIEGNLVVSPSLQAQYEDPIVEYRGRARYYESNSDRMPVVARGQTAISNLAVRFSERVGYHMHLQPYLEIVSYDKFFTDIQPAHNGLSLTYLAMGNMPNGGVFLPRGYYMPFEKPQDEDCRVTGSHHLTAYADFEHDRRQMQLSFAVRDESAACGFRGYKLIANYNSFHSVRVDCGRPDEHIRYIYIRLRHPPQLWEAIPYRMQQQQQQQQGNRRPFTGNNRPTERLDLTRCKEWLRTQSWPGNMECRQGIGCSREALGNSPVLAMGIPKKLYKRLRQKSSGPDPDIYRPTRELFEILGRWKRKVRGLRVLFGSVKKIIWVDRSREVLKNLPDLGSYRANYALSALCSRGMFITDQLAASDSIFYDRLIWSMKECSMACEEALEQLLAAVDEKRNVTLLTAFDRLYEIRLSDHKRALAGENVEQYGPDLPNNCVLVRKIMVTPLRLLLLSPEVLMNNRVMRKFGEEYALRVVLRDDNGSKLQMNNFFAGRSQEDRSTIVEQMVRGSLQNGLTICNRRYDFLAWSNSQLRDQGVYMYATARYPDRKTGEWHTATIEDIRHWMGDFTAAKNVSKCMSRMAQCFTQSVPTIVLKRSDWRLEEDVTGGMTNPETGTSYVFSDGCGSISIKKASQAFAKIGVTPLPSCFQFRHQGCKGVLTLEPSLDTLQKEGIVFRESQKKFDDPENSSQVLEIVKWSMPSPVFLNRPLIMILDQVSKKQGRDTHQRVRNRVHGLLELELNNMADMLLSETDSIEALTQRLPVKMDFHQLGNNGFLLTEEPFFRSILLAIHRYNIKQQLHKAKIAIPAHLGRTVYGVLDETGTLQYGQVFVRYTKSVRVDSDAEEDLIVHTGKIMVTKNPCLVPGDVRILEAVDYPCFDHMRNVIVFPRHGPRPHPDEMAGSDLDGDEYAVFFDHRMMFDRNEDAMNFPKVVASDARGPPTTTDMIDCFLKYLSQDSVGQMCNAFMMAADYHGIYSDICESIARKCSLAVDFPKTGHPADRLLPEEKLYRCPDFMQKDHRPSYRSKRLVGQLFRKAKKVEDILDIGQCSINVDYYDPDLYDSDLFKRKPNLKQKCVAVRDQYNARMQQIMDEYGISDEGSLVSGHMVSVKNRISEMEKEDFSFYNTDKIIELRYNRVYEEYRQLFFQVFHIF